ncbi:helix-turn-helix protein [Mucilaginibacter yixingensis]|uniref:Helix-turn-helix protein n=1 Tax=Mucilaginibacter yixingensis TaxID=1295612 RepID=A0A2T5J7X0_9SPHI|nr:helix-turn-helix transcriptional regulator [Mucilaginibacter yixingensis]PTQ95561.1 helix-turn-helix protein [Mucilaginibacter yixingensis]
MKQSLENKIRTVAINIRRIRESKDYTQDYLAVKLNISQNAYSKIELGYTKITVERLFQIAQILEVDPVALINFSDEEQTRLLQVNGL